MLLFINKTALEVRPEGKITFEKVNEKSRKYVLASYSAEIKAYR